jgi:superfamily II DNA helicase RecQ
VQASCTPVVEAGIIKLLQLKAPVLIKGGFNRPNIQYTVSLQSSEQAADIAIGMPFWHGCQGSCNCLLHIKKGFMHLCLVAYLPVGAAVAWCF